MRTNGFPLNQCKLCHGSSYGGGNVVPISCRDCHDNTAGPEECNTCHGDFSGTDFLAAAPPKSVSRDTSTTIRGVGAHQKHLITGTFGKSVKCQECHSVPTQVSASGHIDSPFNVQVAFNDTLASLKTNSGTIIPTPVYLSSTISCLNVYCHGYFKNGNLTNNPIWNKVDGTQADCGTCHGNSTSGNPLPGGTHLQGSSFYSCQTCHTTGTTPVATYNSGTNTWTITDQTRHLNGKLSRFGSESSF
jgi:predicted CxxxxCH...CXXCH cytochrome family protein